jgi:hypothetical protein
VFLELRDGTQKLLAPNRLGCSAGWCCEAGFIACNAFRVFCRLGNGMEWSLKVGDVLCYRDLWSLPE